MKNLNQLATQIHEQNHHWWTDLETGEPLERNKGELLMLVISELAEAMEAVRKDLMDSHLPHRKGAEVEMADSFIRLLDIAAAYDIDLKDFEKELTDCNFDELELSNNKGEGLYYICGALCQSDWAGFRPEPITEDQVQFAIVLIMAYCHKFGYDLEGAVHEKLAYNRTREDHKPENRRDKNGKKF